MSLLHKQIHFSVLAVALVGLCLALAPGALANSAIDQYVEFEPSPEDRHDKDLVTSNPDGGDSGSGDPAAGTGIEAVDPVDGEQGSGGADPEATGANGKDDSSEDGSALAGSADDGQTPGSVLKSAVGGGDVGLELRDLLLPMVGFLLSLAIAVFVSNRIRGRVTE